MFHACELQQRLPGNLHMPKNIDVASDGVVKREQTRSGSDRQKMAASRRNLNGLRLPAAAQATGALLLSRLGDGVVEASLVELQPS